MKYLLAILVLLGAAFAQNSTVRSVSTLPATCNPGGGAGGAPADHVDLWTGSANIAYYCSAANTWTPILTQAGVGIGTSTNSVLLLPALPNGETASTQSCGDASMDVASDAFVQCAIANISPAPSYSGNQLISGGGVEWTGGLNFTVGAATYTIAGTLYTSPLTNVTLATADPSNPRLDVIGVNSSGSVFTLTGTPSANPAAPSVDPTSQLQLTIVLVPANSATASVTKVDIYHECTEWILSTSGAPVNSCASNNPYDGSNNIQITAGVAGNYVNFMDPASGTVQMQNYNNLVLYVDPSAWSSGMSLSLQWFFSGTAKGVPVVVRTSGTFGFNAAVASYQQISVPTSLFGINGIPVTALRITVSGTGGTITTSIDDITLQGGQNGQPLGSFMTWRGTYSTTTGYNLNDTVYYQGVSWVNVNACTNCTPSLTSPDWQYMTNIGTNQQVIFNNAGVLSGSAGLLFNPSNFSLTVAGPLSAQSLTTTGPGAFTLQGSENTCTLGLASTDFFCANSATHRWTMNTNNGGNFYIPGLASAGTGGHAVVLAANGIDIQDGGASPGSGTVTSVGLSVNSGSSSGIFAITGSPVSASGTLNFNLSGTSGGHPYFSSSTALSSTTAQTTHGVWLAQGAGNADTTTGAGTAHQTLVSGGSSADPVYQDQRDVHIVPACASVGGTASGGLTYASGWTATNRAGSNNLGCALQAAPNAGGTVYTNSFLFLPSDWDTGSQPYITILYGSGANTSGTVIWTVSSACTKQDGSVTDDPAFNAESAFATQTMTTANRTWGQNGQFTAVTSGNNCIVGSPIIFKIALSGTASSAINLYQISVVFPTQPQVKAN